MSTYIMNFLMQYYLLTYLCSLRNDILQWLPLHSNSWLPCFVSNSYCMIRASKNCEQQFQFFMLYALKVLCCHGFRVPGAYIIYRRISLRKRIQNFKYTFRYGCEYLSREKTSLQIIMLKNCQVTQVSPKKNPRK